MNSATADEYTRIADAAPRAVVRVCGRIHSVRIEPAGAAPTLTARVQDASGRIDAVFMGRRGIPGVEPGQYITLEGRVAAGESVPRMFNPRYELICRP